MSNEEYYDSNAASQRLNRRLCSLVDADAGVISAEIYSDPEIYQLELERIFAKSWLLLCPEDQIAHAGDYFVTYMGEDPVIVVRQKDNSVAAFLNQCRHRGGALCRGESGNTKGFTCTYHGWSYDTAGQLVSIPMESQIYAEPVDRSQWSARRVPKIEIHHGLIFGCWDENAPSFRESLGDAAIYFDLNFGRTNAGSQSYGGVYKWRIAANWKLGAEQFTSDHFHFFTTHGSGLMALAEDGSPPFVPQPGRSFSSVLGHGGGFYVDPRLITDVLRSMTSPEYERYVAQTEQPQAIERYGETLGSAYPIFANFFPTAGYLHSNRTLRVWIPRGPGEMEVWAWTLIDKDAPDDIRDLRRKVSARTFGPAGIFEQDDTANWVDVQRPLSGTIARRTKLNVQMGSASQVEGWPGLTDIDNSEVGARHFYRRWLHMLTSDSGVDHAA